MKYNTVAIFIGVILGAILLRLAFLHGMQMGLLISAVQQDKEAAKLSADSDSGNKAVASGSTNSNSLDWLLTLNNKNK